MTTFSGQVSLSSDDSDQLFGATPTNSLTDPSITLGLAAARRRWAGFRFQNVTIPPGATIVSAILSIFVPSGGNVNMAATILGNLTANPSTFAATSNYLASLADTSHTVSWSATLTANAFNASPDISAIITELIGQLSPRARFFSRHVTH